MGHEGEANLLILNDFIAPVMETPIVLEALPPTDNEAHVSLPAPVSA